MLINPGQLLHLTLVCEKWLTSAPDFGSDEGQPVRVLKRLDTEEQSGETSAVQQALQCSCVWGWTLSSLKSALSILPKMRLSEGGVSELCLCHLCEAFLQENGHKWSSSSLHIK